MIIHPRTHRLAYNPSISCKHSIIITCDEWNRFITLKYALEASCSHEESICDDYGYLISMLWLSFVLALLEVGQAYGNLDKQYQTLIYPTQ